MYSAVSRQIRPKMAVFLIAFCIMGIAGSPNVKYPTISLGSNHLVTTLLFGKYQDFSG